MTEDVLVAMRDDVGITEGEEEVDDTAME